jgi:molecular chaperone HtpG
MTSASGIVLKESWPLVSPGDAAVLVLAILLHDCAMHLTEDGFVSLVDSVSSRSIIPNSDDEPWPVLWSDFLGEASRFDAKKLFGLFGNTEPAHNPGLDPTKWNQRDKMLIGEFLRRHHPRLAHEVALWGVPAVSDNPLRLQGIPNDLADLAGIVARSHGRSIRSCFPYLQRYDLREYKGIHSVFLMSLVRVADYIQAQSDRAPREALQVRRLRSPVSQGEWKAHDAIRDIRYTHEDPEAVFVDAAPPDVKTYLKLRRLLAAVQSELDASWAVLGEVYGRYDELNALGLKLRRVRSNLDDEGVFARSVPYIPTKASFETAGSDLLSLMIGPLYGAHPEIGIRELIQNAVDACREMRDRIKQMPRSPQPDFLDQAADVLVTLTKSTDDEFGWLEVSDKGIGMTASTVQDYFLKAGASFRRSDAWREAHETSGKSRVLRSGRFGVGVLASFLLGDELEVSTRHVESPPEDAICFAASVDSEEIELRRCTRPVGTTIRVKVSGEEVWKALRKGDYDYEKRRSIEMTSWDWFCLGDPSVVRVFQENGKSTFLEQQFSVPPLDSGPDEHWHKIAHQDFNGVYWTYRAHLPHLTCNGIRVIDPDRYDEVRQAIEPLWEGYSVALACPNVSVFDPDGHLPLLLQRNGLATNKYPFHQNLLDDVLKDTLAFALVCAPHGHVTDAAFSKSYEEWFPGFVSRSARWLPYFSLPTGCGIVDDFHLRAAASKRALLIPLEAGPQIGRLGLDVFNWPEVIVPFALSGGPQDERAWIRFAIGRSRDWIFGPARDLPTQGARMLLLKKTLKELRQPGLIAAWYWDQIEEEFEGNGWVVLRSGQCPSGGLEFEKIARVSSDKRLEGITEWFLGPAAVQGAEKPPVEKRSPIAKAWADLIGDPIIPFGQVERREKFRSGFERLAEYVKAHKSERTEAAASAKP